MISTIRLAYISPLRYPSERAGSLFSVKSCEAFARVGVETELWIPWRYNPDFHTDVFTHYGVERTFKVRKFFAIDLTQYGTWAYPLLYITFALSVFTHVLFKKKDIILYSHEQFALFLLTFISRKTFYEVHDFPGDQKLYQILFKRLTGVVTTNSWKGRELPKRFHISPDKVLVVPNAVSPEDFSINLSKEESREKLGLDKETYIIGYVGGLKTMGMEKGVATAIDSLAYLPDTYKLYVVGGEAPQDIQYYRDYATEKKLVDRVIFVGPVAHADVPTHIAACDVLVAPFPANEHYSHYMSPMKVFEYMASHRPIVVTDLPTLTEVLTDGETALIVPPSDAQALAQAIQKLVQDPALAEKLADAAYTEVTGKYTWSKRAERILSFLSQKIG